MVDKLYSKYRKQFSRVLKITGTSFCTVQSFSVIRGFCNNIKLNIHINLKIYNLPLYS